MPLRPEDSFYADLPLAKRIKAFGWANTLGSLPQGTVRREKFQTFNHMIAACKVIKYHGMTFTTAEEIYRHERKLPVQQQLVGNLLNTLYKMTESFLKNPDNRVEEEYKKQPPSAQLKNMFALIGSPTPANIKYIEEKTGGKWNPDGSRATHPDRPHVGIEGERTVYLVRYMVRYLATYANAFGLDLSLSIQAKAYIDALVSNGSNGITGVPNVAIIGEFPLPTQENAEALADEDEVFTPGNEDDFEVVVLSSGPGAANALRSVTTDEAAKLTAQAKAEVAKYGLEAEVKIEPIVSDLVASASTPAEAPIEPADNSISQEQADQLFAVVTKQLAAMNVKAMVVIKPKAKVTNTLGTDMKLSLSDGPT